MTRGWVVLVMAVLATSFQSLHAQSGRDALRATIPDTVRAGYLARTVSDAITVTGEPRSLQVVRVPIPESVKGTDDLRFELEPEPQFHVISTRGGRLQGRAASADLLVTLAVPADARAGQRVAARVVFRSAQLQVEVPIALRVTPVYRVVVIAPAQIDGLRPGQRFDVGITIRNDGNAADSIHLMHVVPTGWTGGSRDTTLVLLSHESLLRTIRLTVPKHSGTGSFFLRTAAASHAAEVAALTTLAVGNRGADEPPPGVMVRTSLGSVAVEGDQGASIAQVAVSGPLTSSIRIDGRIASRPSLGSAAIRGLSRVGSYATTPHLTAWSSTWRATFGSTVADFSDITGVNAGGSGVAFDYDNQKSTLEFRAARPAEGSVSGAGGSMLGLAFGDETPIGRVSASAAQLRTGGPFEQSLSALGMQLLSPRIRDTQFMSGVAFREYADGSASGVGIVAGAEHHTASTQADFRVVHAPGGSDAFARAENEVLGNVMHAVSSRLSLGATVYRSDDANRAARRVRSRTFGLSQQYVLNDEVTLYADQRSMSFDADADPFSFGNSQRHFGAGAAVRRSSVMLSTDMSIERLTRTVQATDINSSESGYAFNWHGAVSRALSFGAFAFDATYGRSAPATGYVPDQILLGLRADRAQLPVGPRNLFLDGEIGYSRWSGIRSMATVRAGATYVLPYDMEIAAAVERNPQFYSGSAQVPWVFALRVDKSISMPRIVTGTAAGVVFQDYNGNGKQDADEPGMPDVTLRRGSARATTSHDGHYRFWEQTSGRTIVDPASLPYGWVVSNRSSGENIALVPTTRVEIVLEPGAAERVRNIDLSGAVVMARDAEGREWIARRTGPMQAVFEALPVGPYTLHVDFSALAEPLRVDGVPPQLQVTRETSMRVVVPVSGRPLRFKGQ